MLRCNPPMWRVLDLSMQGAERRVVPWLKSRWLRKLTWISRPASTAYRAN
jgi:hypothetical protein